MPIAKEASPIKLEVIHYPVKCGKRNEVFTIFLSLRSLQNNELIYIVCPFCGEDIHIDTPHILAKYYNDKITSVVWEWYETHQ